MEMLNRLSKFATICGCTLLLCFSFAAAADEIQDISKLFKQGKQEQALTRVNALLAKKPKDAPARFLKGLILTEQSKTNEAIKVFSDLTEDFPELPEPYNNVAVLYASLGQYDKARIALEMAIRTHPSYATAHENLGDIYAKMASQAYDRALQLDHDNASTQTKLSMVKEIFATGPVKGGKPGKTVRRPQVAMATAPDAATPDGDGATPPESAPATKKGTSASKETTVVAPVVVATKGAPAVPSVSEAAEREPEAVAEGGNAAEPKHQSAGGKGDATEVLKSVHKWAAAWSSKNVAGYLASYAGDFKVPDNASRADWEALRTDRIRKPKSIQVVVANAQVNFIDDTHAGVYFKQTYHAGKLHLTSGKSLVLVKSGDNWLIQEERSEK